MFWKNVARVSPVDGCRLCSVKEVKVKDKDSSIAIYVYYRFCCGSHSHVVRDAFCPIDLKVCLTL